MLAGTDLPSPGRALVALNPKREAPHPHRALHGTASFVAQLIANVHRMPQARERRKADPAEVIAAYRETIARLRELSVKS